MRAFINAFLDGSIPHVAMNRAASVKSANLTRVKARESPHSSTCVCNPDRADASFITCFGILIFIGVGMSPVKISSASCQMAHRMASILVMLPLPSFNSSQNASTMIATLKECSATDCGRRVGMIVHLSTSSHSSAYENRPFTGSGCLKILDLHSCLFISPSCGAEPVWPP